MTKKTMFGALLTLALCGPAWAAKAQSYESRTLSVTAGGELTFSSAVGDVEIRLWERGEITLAARGIDEREFKVEQNGNAVRIDYRGRGRNVRFDLQVPARFNLKLSTGGGDVGVFGNLEGRLNISTLGGDINFGDVQGEARISTNGGDIQGGSIAGNSLIDTLGGDIDLGWVEGTLDVTTQGGDISVRGSGSTMKAKTLGGDVDVGDIGGEANVSTLGGDVIVGRVSGKTFLKTLGGDIELRSCTGDVIANTMGGDIRLREIAGSIEAETAGGDIDAELAGSAAAGSSLRSRGGDLTLRVPAGSAITVQAKIRLRGSRRDDHAKYGFISDFPQTGGESNDIEKNAVFEINGGGALVTLETSNGNIRILRSR